MKRTRTLIVALVVLVLLVVGVVVVKKVEQHVDSIKTIDEQIISLEESNINAFEWTYEEGSLAFAKNDSIWNDPNDAKFPVDQDKIKDFLKDFENVHASFIIDNVEDYGQYGLDNPEAVIKFTLTEGELTVKLGAYSVMDEKRYVSIGDGKVYLIDEDLLEHVSIERDNFFLHDKLTQPETVTGITISGENGLNVVYDAETLHTYTDFYNYYAVEGGKYRALSTDAIEDFDTSIFGLNLKTYETYTASEEDLSIYGLDNPAFTVTVKGRNTVEEATKDKEAVYEDNSQTIYVGYVIDTDTKVEEGEEPAKLVYVRVADSEIVYKVSNTLYDTLAGATYETLRPATVVYIKKNNILSMSTTLESTKYDINYVITSEEGADTEEGAFFINDYEINVNDIVAALNDLNITEQGVSKTSNLLELSLDLHLDNETYGDVSIDMYRYDGDSVYVEMNGEAVGLVKRSSMVALREALMTEVLNLGKEATEE